MLTVVLCLFGVARVLIGLAPILAPDEAARLLGFPREHDNPSSRVMARLFGVRDIGLGVLAFAAAAGTVPVGFTLLLNGATDVGDAAVFSHSLYSRDGIDRAAISSLVVASLAAVAWFATWALLT